MEAQQGGFPQNVPRMSHQTWTKTDTSVPRDNYFFTQILPGWLGAHRRGESLLKLSPKETDTRPTLPRLLGES